MVRSSQRLPVTTYLGHTARALSCYESNFLYFALGKASKWDGEDTTGFVPPEPDLAAKNLDGLECMKKVTQKQLVIPSDDGEIEYDGSKWKIVTPEQAVENQSRWVYLTTTLYYSEVNLLTYRQVGIFDRVQAKSGVTSEILLPNQIEDLGLLIALNNRYSVTRQTDTRDVYSVIIEF